MLSRRNRLRPRSRHHRLRLTRPTSCPRSSGKSCRCCRSSFGESSKTARREALSQGTETTECVMRTMEPLRITERLRFQGDAGSYRKGRLRSPLWKRGKSRRFPAFGRACWHDIPYLQLLACFSCCLPVQGGEGRRQGLPNSAVDGFKAGEVGSYQDTYWQTLNTRLRRPRLSLVGGSL